MTAPPAAQLGHLQISDGATIPFALCRHERSEGAWLFKVGQWTDAQDIVDALATDGDPLYTALNGIDQGVRLWRDMILVANPRQSAMFRWDGAKLVRLPHALPDGAHFADAQGRDGGARFVDLDADGLEELVFSTDDRFGVDRFEPATGWKPLREARRSSVAPADAIPPFVVNGANNGAWFHSGHLWIQNEDTDHLPDHVDRRTFPWLLNR